MSAVPHPASALYLKWSCHDGPLSTRLPAGFHRRQACLLPPFFCITGHNEAGIPVDQPYPPQTSYSTRLCSLFPSQGAIIVNPASPRE